MKKVKPDPTQDQLKELFDYDPRGYLVVKKSIDAKRPVGQVVGIKPQKALYKMVSVRHVPYYLHRLIWIWHNGELTEALDHVNRVKHDNRIENLRIATPGQNNANWSKRPNMTSKWKGVSWMKQNNRWRATLVVNGKQQHLGLFVEEADAAMVYNEKALEIWGDFAVLNNSEENQ